MYIIMQIIKTVIIKNGNVLHGMSGLAAIIFLVSLGSTCRSTQNATRGAIFFYYRGLLFVHVD